MKLVAGKCPRGSLYDRHGEEISEALAADTTTGEVTTLVRLMDGGVAIDDATEELCTKIVKYPAPLTFCRYVSTREKWDRFKEQQAAQSA